ncbi:MAG: 30S ribosomal protein S21 [Bacteroidia bacterium]
MLIIDIKDGEALDKALRRFKKKFEKVGILKETRRRSTYSKPSEVKKEQLKKAVSRQRYYVKENF